MIAQYLDLSDITNVQTQTLLFKVLGQMPFELFSASEAIIFTDREGLESASMLIDKLGHENCQAIV